jgi:hypothetical protein
MEYQAATIGHHFVGRCIGQMLYIRTTRACKNQLHLIIRTVAYFTVFSRYGNHLI